ncbi:MAG: recombinase family protein [Crocinitomicaceae bacterium]|nr:recombinase family protein [Crocinitomicaceae bacterium]
MSDLNQFQSFAYKDNSIRVSGNNAVIYTRVSHSSQEDNTSLESQEKYCKAFAERKGLNVVAYFGGTHESAKTDDRKEFKRMLKFIKQSKNVSHIVVYSYERFSRTGIHGGVIADDLLRKYGVVTLSVTQELDPTTSAGSFQQKILFLFGQMDNEMRRDKTITGMRELLLKGYTPHHPPRGFTNLNKGKAVNQKIVVNEEGKLIRKAFMWKAKKGMANVDISRKLKTLGLELDRRRLQEIFANPYYCGLITHSLIPNMVVEGRHEPMVSRSIFLKVNQIVQDNRKKNHPTTHNELDENLPLKKFMKCADCDTPMTGYLVKAKGLYYYKCRTTGCKHNVSAKKIHEDFIQLVSLFQIDEVNMPLIEEAITIYFEAYFSEHEENKTLVQKQIQELQAKINKMEERFAIGEIDASIFNKFHPKYIDELKELQAESEKYLQGSSNLQKCLKKAFEICLNPALLWNSKDAEGKLRLQKKIFPEGISVDKQNREVRTIRINSIFAPIFELAKVLKDNKKGQPIKIDELSALVTTAGFKPATF